MNEKRLQNIERNSRRNQFTLNMRDARKYLSYGRKELVEKDHVRGRDRKAKDL